MTQTSPRHASGISNAILEDLVAANHILYDQGVVDAFGHISVRHEIQTIFCWRGTWHRVR